MGSPEKPLAPWSKEWVAAQWSNEQETWRNSRPGWLADQYADTSDPVLYNATMQTASSLGGLLVALWREADSDDERTHWVARKALVDDQRHAVDPHDRAGMVAQQEAWMEQFYMLQDRRVPCDETHDARVWNALDEVDRKAQEAVSKGQIVDLSALRKPEVK